MLHGNYLNKCLEKSRSWLTDVYSAIGCQITRKWVDGAYIKDRYSTNSGVLPTTNSLDMEFGIASQAKKPRLSLGHPEGTKGGNHENTHEQSKRDFEDIMELMGMAAGDIAFPEPKTNLTQDEAKDLGPEPVEPFKHVDEAGIMSGVSAKYSRLMIIRDTHFIQDYNL